MIKKYIYAGAILLIIAAVVFYMVSSYITSGTPTSITNVTVPAHGIANVPVLVNGSQISILFVFASTPTNIYFINGSLFSGLSAYLGANPAGSAYSYVAGRNLSGKYMFRDNSTAVDEIYQTSSPGNSLGSYYIYTVIDSTPGSSSYNGVVNASIVYKAYSYNDWIGKSGEALVAIGAFIAGVALVIYGAIKKPKLPPAEATEAVVPPAAPKRKRER